jgi:DNA (cytosine-5)-methyltransferase 1
MRRSQPKSHGLPCYKAIDLFSGCGGLTQGLKKAGFNVLAAVELDALAIETYRSNHAEVCAFNADIRTVTGKDLLGQLRLKRGELDLLAGCPPCQGFSRLREKRCRQRMSDSRNQLIDEVSRLVESLLPKVVLLENVPNLAEYCRYADFRRSLRRLGYEISEAVIDVANYGVPQRRRRMVVLASRLGSMTHPQPSATRYTVRDAIGQLPAPEFSEDLLHNLGETRSDRIRRLIQHIPKDGGSRTDLPKGYTLKCHARTDGYYDVYGRMSWDDVSPTITGGCINPSKGRFLHPEQDRAITLREASLLQSFPCDYLFSLKRGKYAAAEMIGNALPPEFSRIQGEAIKVHLDAYIRPE